MSIFSDYYHKDLDKFFNHLIPGGSSLVKSYNQRFSKRYDYILLSNSLAYIDDIQMYIKRILKNCYPKSRVVVVYFNFLWKPLLDLATYLGLRKRDIKEPNWLSADDIHNLFFLEGFNEVIRGKRFLLPIDLGPISSFINNFIAQLPLINQLCLTTYQIFRPAQKSKKYSISIVIPARNEEGNIKDLLNKIPQMSKNIEVIFVEGYSTDKTDKAIKEEIKNNQKDYIKAYVYKQKGEGKADAVRLGFNKAKNDILMILDADLAVDPRDLPKFYKALSKGYGDFANGSRLVYPMEKQAMRTLNYIGNKFFSLMFTFLLGQRIRDTLCGTKAFFRQDYLRIERNRKFFRDLDPFGDYDLLFGATKLNLKIVEIPVRYKERVYGKSNIRRFTHAWLLLKMIILAARQIKFI